MLAVNAYKNPVSCEPIDNQPPEGDDDGEFQVIPSGKFQGFRLKHKNVLGLNAGRVYVYSRNSIPRYIGYVNNGDLSAFMAGHASVFTPDDNWRLKWSRSLIELLELPGKLHSFRFKVMLPATHPTNGGNCDTGERFITLQLFQEQFENYHGLKDRLYAALSDIGIHKSDLPYWRQCPEVQPGFEEMLRQAIGADASAQFTAHYPHGWKHASYKKVDVGGVPVVYQSFDHGRLIKWAPSMELVGADMAKLVDIAP